jgi:2-methylcitrate dehydratase PrpD
MTELTYTKTLAAHVAETQFEDISPTVVELAKQKTLDMLGCFVYGVVLPGPSAAARVVSRMGGVEEATVTRRSQRVPAALAALANGTASHSFEMDDRQPASALHPGSSLVPAALAASEARGLSGRDYLAALTLGHDVGCRIGAAIAEGGKKRRGYHGMGSWASIGAAAAAAKAIGLTASQVEQTMGISTATGFAMDFVSAAEGAKGYHAGKAAMGGIIAAELVEAGMVGPVGALETRVVGAERMQPGYLDLLSDLPDPARLLQDLGKVYELENTGTKRYPGDGCMQAGVDAVRSLSREHGIKPDEIEAIKVYSMTHVKEENTYVRPTKPIEAFFSYPHVLAIALLDGDVTPKMALPEYLERSDVHEIREKVELIVDPEYDKMWPGARPARVQIVTSGRGTFEETVLYSLGTSQNPMSWDDYVEKFTMLAEEGLGADGAKRVIDVVARLDTLAEIGELTALLRP